LWPSRPLRHQGPNQKPMGIAFPKIKNDLY